eukprot:2129555-Pyramimonas_sp.AAC.1
MRHAYGQQTASQANASQLRDLLRRPAGAPRMRSTASPASAALRRASRATPRRRIQSQAISRSCLRTRR